MRSVTYANALLKLYELADREDPRFQAAAARWHARFTLEARLPLSESQMVMNMLCGLRGANYLAVRRQLLAHVERAGLAACDIPAASSGSPDNGGPAAQDKDGNRSNQRALRRVMDGEILFGLPDCMGQSVSPDIRHAAAPAPVIGRGDR